MFLTRTNYHNSTDEIKNLCSAKSDQQVLTWYNNVGGTISRLRERPDPTRPAPTTALARLKEKQDILRTVLEKRGCLLSDTGSSCKRKREEKGKEKETSTLTSPVTKNLTQTTKKWISVGTQTDPFECPLCNNNPELHWDPITCKVYYN